MDSQGEGTTWFGNIFQKLRTLRLVVDDIPFEESFKYVEEQLVAASENVRQFCTEVINDVLSPDMVDSMNEEARDLVSEQNRNNDLISHEGSNTDGGVDHEKGILSNINASSHASLVEPVEENHIDSSFKQNADIGVHEEANVGIKADIPSAQLSANFVTFFKSSEIKFADKEGTYSGNAISAVSSGAADPTVSMTGPCNSGVDLDDAESRVFMYLTHSGIPESSVLVDRNEIGSIADLEEENIRLAFSSRMKLLEQQILDQRLASCSENDDPKSSHENSKSSLDGERDQLALDDDDWEII